MQERRPQPAPLGAAVREAVDMASHLHSSPSPWAKWGAHQIPALPALPSSLPSHLLSACTTRLTKSPVSLPAGILQF